MKNNVVLKNGIEKGVVSRIIADKGYGWIKRPSGSTIFFHASRVISPKFAQLHEGDEVEYSIQDTPKGLSAVDVAVID